eukprot:COSAG02_NODE_3132_length_7308_cov_6.430157_1_plen_224_part_00
MAVVCVPITAWAPSFGTTVLPHISPLARRCQPPGPWRKFFSPSPLVDDRGTKTPCSREIRRRNRGRTGVSQYGKLTSFRCTGFAPTSSRSRNSGQHCCNYNVCRRTTPVLHFDARSSTNYGVPTVAGQNSSVIMQITVRYLVLELCFLWNRARAGRRECPTPCCLLADAPCHCASWPTCARVGAGMRSSAAGSSTYYSINTLLVGRWGRQPSATSWTRRALQQ